MSSQRVILVREVAGAWYYSVPTHVLLFPVAPMDRVTVLDSSGRHEGLSAEQNKRAHSAIQAINALKGTRVIDIGNFSDGTSRFNVLVPTSGAEEIHRQIVAILRDAFDLHDCSVEVVAN